MLEVGFARVNITPQFGVNLQGYYYERHADGILDPLYGNVIAVSDGERTAALLSLDIIGLQKSGPTGLRNYRGADRFPRTPSSVRHPYPHRPAMCPPSPDPSITNSCI